MDLMDIANKIDETISKIDVVVEQKAAEAEASDAKDVAQHIVKYVLEHAQIGDDPRKLGATMLQGACIGEDGSSGFISQPVIEFLEELLAGAKEAIGQ